jgi:hypothetical protein
MTLMETCGKEAMEETTLEKLKVQDRPLLDHTSRNSEGSFKSRSLVLLAYINDEFRPGWEVGSTEISSCFFADGTDVRELIAQEGKVNGVSRKALQKLLDHRYL